MKIIIEQNQGEYMTMEELTELEHDIRMLTEGMPVRVELIDGDVE